LYKSLFKLPIFLLFDKEARKHCYILWLIDVLALVLFRESASQSIAVFIILFLKEERQRTGWLIANFFTLVYCQGRL